MEYSNGIVGDMCIHMLDTVRWMLGLGWPTSVVSQGGILVDKQAKANTTDTQTACFDFDDLQVWRAAPRGDTAPDPEVPVGGLPLRRQGHAQVEREQFDLSPRNNRGGQAKPIHRDCKMELEEYPETRPRRISSATLPQRCASTCLIFSTPWPRSRPARTLRRGTSPP